MATTVPRITIPPTFGSYCRRLLRAGLSLCLLSALSGCGNHAYFSFLNPQGPIAAAQRTHFIEVVVILAVFVALPIFVLSPWLMWRYRYNARKSRYAPGWKAYLPLEIMTWAGPMIIVAVLGYLLWSNAHALDPYKPLAAGASGDAPVRVQAIGYDWKWLFIYPDQGIASVGVMPIPVGRPVAMKLTSATVMQSLQIPALVGQIYAMGGMKTQLHFKAAHRGRFLGENTMYNGNGFHKQKFTAIAMRPGEFDAWVHKVRNTGLSLDATVYQELAQQNTREQLAATLMPDKPHADTVYLKDVNPGLFDAVVRATMQGGMPVLPLSEGGATTPSTVAAKKNIGLSSPEEQP